METIKEWVYDPNSPKKLIFEIKSASVRKCVDKEVKKAYMNSGMFFNWSRKSIEASVEKTRRF